MAYLQGVKEFDAAFTAHWSYSNEDGIPKEKPLIAQQDYWADYLHLVQKKVPESKLFALSIAREAKARLDREKPFREQLT